MYEDKGRTQRYRAGRLEIRPDEHAALVDGRPLSLTLRELQLLTELASNAERILSREELYEAVWGRPPRRSDRSLDVYVSRLRGKLGRRAAGAAADPHAYRDRLPLLARRQLGAFHIFFT